MQFYNKEIIEKILDYKKVKKLYKLKHNEPQLYADIVAATSYLGEDSSLTERIWHCTFGNVDTLCKVCKAKTKWKPSKNSYAVYCSSSCANKDVDKIRNIQNTMESRYGVKHALQSKQFLDKSKETLIQNYGVASPLQSDTINSKRKSTNMIKYGMEESGRSEQVRQNRKNNVRKTYGVDNISQLDAVKVKTKTTMLEKYGVTCPPNLASNREKYKKRTGFPWQVQRKYLTREALFILESKEELGKLYECGKSLVDISNILNCSDVTVGNYFKYHELELRTGRSAAEMQIDAYIRSIYAGLVINNDKTVLGGKEVDILLPDKKIGIEYCGLFWHSNKFLDKNYHRNKLVNMNKAGYRLITIFENEWVHNRELVEHKLANIIGASVQHKIFARNTAIKKILNVKLIKQFLETNHIQGYASASLNYGLYDLNNNIVALCCLKKINDTTYSLVRFATSCRVIGGFSKILKHVIADNNHINNIETFADLRWSEGQLYENNGFTAAYTIPPDYGYIIGNNLYHKSNFRKTKFKASDKTESTIMREHGINKIYDCGKIKYIWHREV